MLMGCSGWLLVCYGCCIICGAFSLVSRWLLCNFWGGLGGY